MRPSRTIDRPSRNRLSCAIRKYLADATTAFQFDEEICGIADSTSDKTVDFVVAQLWLHYDDCVDHFCVLTKQEWDYFQRLMLLLDSDAHIQIRKARRWSPTQLGALVALTAFVVLFAACAANGRLGSHWLLFGIPFGPISILLAWLHHRLSRFTPRQAALYPFASVGEILRVRRRTPFTKASYPAGLARRSIRSGCDNFVVLFPFYVAWCAAAPLALLWQTLPDVEQDTLVVM